MEPIQTSKHETPHPLIQYQLHLLALEAGSHFSSPVPVEVSRLESDLPAFRQESQCQQNHDGSDAAAYSDTNAIFDVHSRRRLGQSIADGPRTPRQGQNVGVDQSVLITPQPASSDRPLQQSFGLTPLSAPELATNGHIKAKIVVDPPHLEEWRQRLFGVDEMITLSEDEYQTYFPHVDNVYSHRSTQTYKRKPFVSHYWDCRLKGRPSGTPKSDDPNKKKRKRTARERDLCDVKIKITEYFPGAFLQPGFVPDDGTAVGASANFFTSGPGMSAQAPFAPDFRGLQPWNLRPGNIHPGSNGQRYYTIQRVNGNGGNGKSDGIAGAHKHTLEESDKVKKNSVQRFLAKTEMDKKKSQKSYHTKATGDALATVRKHTKDHDLKLFGGCFCPFVQRVWIALEVKKMEYQYIEVDPYKKPKELLEVNPRGLVPGIRHGDWGCGESTVLMEYLEDLGIGQALFPVENPKLKATCRLWTDHISKKILPAFYGYLQAQKPESQIEHGHNLKEQIDELVKACPDPEGPFFLGKELSFVDVQFAPWMLRMKRVLKPYRGWPDAEPGTRWARWLDAIEANEHVRATTSTDELYVESYERYAENRPGTSQVADAINSGQALP